MKREVLKMKMNENTPFRNLDDSIFFLFQAHAWDFDLHERNEDHRGQVDLEKWKGSTRETNPESLRRRAAPYCLNSLFHHRSILLLASVSLLHNSNLN
jgi:hypothetical protein